jgi:hypothetical protein
MLTLDRKCKWRPQSNEPTPNEMEGFICWGAAHSTRLRYNPRDCRLHQPPGVTPPGLRGQLELRYYRVRPVRSGVAFWLLPCRVRGAACESCSLLCAESHCRVRPTPLSAPDSFAFYLPSCASLFLSPASLASALGFRFIGPQTRFVRFAPRRSGHEGRSHSILTPIPSCMNAPW